jgi:hypothetical protein
VVRGRVPRVLIVVVVGLLVVGVAVAGTRVVRQELAVRQIDRHERTWRRHRPSAYRYEVATLCLCVGRDAFTVHVSGGRVVAVDPEPAKPGDVLTIEELFDVARHAVRRGADEVDVSYAADGHPTRIFIDDWKSSVDDEVTFEVRHLTAEGGV